MLPVGCKMVEGGLEPSEVHISADVQHEVKKRSMVDVVNTGWHIVVGWTTLSFIAAAGWALLRAPGREQRLASQAAADLASCERLLRQFPEAA